MGREGGGGQTCNSGDEIFFVYEYNFFDESADCICIEDQYWNRCIGCGIRVECGIFF